MRPLAAACLTHVFRHFDERSEVISPCGRDENTKDSMSDENRPYPSSSFLTTLYQTGPL